MCCARLFVVMCLFEYVPSRCAPVQVHAATCMGRPEGVRPRRSTGARRGGDRARYAGVGRRHARSGGRSLTGGGVCDHLSATVCVASAAHSSGGHGSASRLCRWDLRLGVP